MQLEFNEVGGEKVYVKYSEKKKGDVLVTGTFLKRTKNTFNQDQNDFLFKPLDGGPNVLLNYSKRLDTMLEEENVEYGDIVRITYQGPKKITKGPFVGKNYHTFSIGIAADKVAKKEVVKDVKFAEPKDVKIPPAEDDDDAISLDDLD
jgi:hypothetical protein